MLSRAERVAKRLNTFLQLPAFKEEEKTSAECGRLASHIAIQNLDFTEAEVEADVATAVAATRDNALET